ncbi:zinc finger protein 609-like isoform X1 [Poecilia latipinna]|uniref:Zinc finger protein 609a n=1 Tax=Poecilia latipinna TaxID=48699 RepID=A0A3B3VHL8_9TELE|nr:PREDICTED: zinc finger protein 609-like isoform X1 [Poecilia latipinna]XP_014879421.1 PREDICTED: zinc finger protein 609-like isoform X1 [Poecilia latipinna]XP_014879422.1 PREDICTED: zinc finger protein 609-like isoform X2 [Poecilia latipinna]XP_014879423.1 PREDICTED: zinc finger protein 609-like isoform X1 [Poecilia latipinna]
MSLSSSPAGGKGVDSNAVDTYDSGDEWDIGVGNLIIDLDADLEKDKLEMSSSKEGGAIAAPPGAVAALPDNIKFVSPVAAMQSKDGKSKSKRSKNSKESGKTPDGTKKEAQSRAQGDMAPQNTNSTLTKGTDKSGKASRIPPAVKKDKDVACGKTKKEKIEAVATRMFNTEKESGVAVLPLGAPRNSSFENQLNPELNPVDQFGNLALDSAGIGQAVTIMTEQEEVDDTDCRNLKKVVSSEKMESPFSTCAPPPVHLLGPPANSSDISSSCEQIMVRTRSVAVNTAEASLATEPECLGPCEPGTSVNLEGIVWQETEDGMLVVNVTWRNKTYVGTLLDCTRHDWAPPRFCESPTSDMEMRSGRGRGKRMRPNTNTPLNDNSNSSDSKGSGSKTRGAAATSKGRRGVVVGCGEDAKASPSSAKRKTKPVSDMEPTSSSEDSKASKRMKTNSSVVGTLLPVGKTEALAPPQLERTCPSPILIDCPHPNCNKKYKHINGLKYHQARAHNDHDVRLDQDGDSEYGDDSVVQHDPTSCNGAAFSPARSNTPKGRGFDAPSPSSGKQTLKGKKKAGDGEPEVTDGGEEGGCLTDEASNDGVDDRKARRMSVNSKSDKSSQKSAKMGRPLPLGVASSYSPQASSPALSSVVQSVPSSPQLKISQTKPSSLSDPSCSPTLGKDKKKKDKKKRDSWKEEDSPAAMNKIGRLEEGKSPYSETTDSLLNGCMEAHQSRLASIKAEADKVYSFSDNAPSPSIGVASRIEAGLATPLHQNQNGADNVSVKTSSPAYSDISDAGEDGEGKAEGVKVKSDPDQGPREGAKKTLFSSQAPSKESPYYPNYDSYYSPSYPNPSPGTVPGATAHMEATQMKVKKEEDLEVAEEGKLKVEPPEERKAELGPQQPSVIQPRSNMYSQPLYYNQYYVAPYSYASDPAYHNHLLASNPAYRQQYEERQRQSDKKLESKDRDSFSKDEWKQKTSGPPSVSGAPGLTDLGSKGLIIPAKSKDPAAASEHAKSVIMAKGEEMKIPSTQAEGLKMKLHETSHHGKEEAKPGIELGRSTGVDSTMWYRQEPDSRLWPYMYPSKYSEAAKQQEEERWKDEKERDRKAKEDKPRVRESLQKEEVKEGMEGRIPLPPEEHQGGGKEVRVPHMQFTSPLAQHQGYMSYMQGPYGYSQGFDPSHPGYRGMPAVMMQNYPASYLQAGYPFSSYGGKVAGGDDGEKPSRSSPTVKPPSEAKALDLLQQHASHYKSKSPSVQDNKTVQERDWERDREREREGARPRSSPSHRIIPPHHHLGYPLLSGQYDLSYAAGLSSSAIVASQQASAPSMYPPPRR